MSDIRVAPGLATLLTCIFVVAKIWGKLDWSWWWVFCPVWIPILFVVAIFLIIVILAAILECF